MTLLRARGLTVTPGHAPTPVVRDLDLDLDPGQGLAVVGPSGCGKSTLARALVGLEPRLTGSLRVDDIELVGAGPDRWQAARRIVALCWQDPSTALDPRMSVRRAVAEARQLGGRPPLADDELDGLLARVHFPASLRERRPAQLSGGQRQRAALARALANEPRVLIADEVTSAVDRAVALEICRELARMPAAGTSVLLVTHDLSLLTGVVDEVVVLEHGRAVERGTPSRILAAPKHALTRALVDAIPRLRRPAPP